MEIGKMIGVLILAAATAFLPMKADGAGLGKAAARSVRSHSLRNAHKMSPEILRRDLMRDRASKIRILRNERKVFRYTTRQRARHEVRRGIPANKHLTSRARPGRPLSAAGAEHRFGLSARPQVRETVRLRQGQAVRMNKTIGGKPGVGEITSTKSLPPTSIEKVTALHK